jgi:carboxypeptidase Taq
VADALGKLKARLTDLHGLQDIAYLLVWDQRTTMPPAGTGHRAQHIALLQRLAHEKLTDPEVGRLLDELAPTAASLDPESDDAGLLRLARRMYDKAVQVPTELRGEMAVASAEATPVWQEAKATSNFELFLGPLERNVELRRRYIECFGPQDEPYDVLLDDFEPEMKTAEVARIFSEIKEELVPLIAELRDRDADDSFLRGTSRSTGRSRSITRWSISSATAPTRGASTRPSIRSHPAPASTTSG